MSTDEKKIELPEGYDNVLNYALSFAPAKIAITAAQQLDHLRAEAKYGVEIKQKAMQIFNDRIETIRKMNKQAAAEKKTEDAKVEEPGEE